MHNAIDAYKHGIGIVHQELSVAGNLSVAENIFAGQQPINKLGFVKTRRMYEDAERVLNDMGIHLDPREKLENLSIAMQQIVEIVKVISRNIDTLILDEPTSSLSNNEIEHLFSLIRRLREERNLTVIFISHKLNEVMAICNRVSVLRNGALVGKLQGEEITQPAMIRLMVGGNIDTRNFLAPTTAEGEVVLRAENLCNGRKFRNVSFELRRNRIVGMFGLIGAGRTETVLSMIGADRLESGKIYFEGQEVRFSSPKNAISSGVVYLTENRRDMGLFLTKPISDNIISSSLGDFTTRYGTIDKAKAAEATNAHIRQLNIQPPVTDKPTGTYSGGNQQKILFAKALQAKPKVLIVDEPTRGVDIGVKMTIHQMLRDLADSGIAVLVISSEMPEVLKLSDYVVVMHEGEMKGFLKNDGLSDYDVMARIYDSEEEMK